jgi:hypothetical protein
MAPALTKLVTLDGNASETIDGALTRIMWANESAILYCDGSTWTKIGGKSIPMVAGMGMNGNKSFDVAKTLLSPAAMTDTTNHRIQILRTGIYQVDTQVLWAGPNGPCNVYLWISDGATVIERKTDTMATSATVSQVTGSPYLCAAGDFITATAYYSAYTTSLVGDTTNGVLANYLTVKEVSSW